MSKIAASTHDQNDRIPTYEESIATPSLRQTAHKPAPGSSIQQRLAETRSRRIQNLISSHLEPGLATLGHDGVARKLFIFIPADIFPDGRPLSRQNLLSPNAAHADVVTLQGDDHRASFWQQPSVVAELQRRLQSEYMNITPDPVPDTPIPPPEISAPSALPHRPPRRQSWFKRSFNTPTVDHDPTGSTGQWQLGWRSEDDDPFPRTPLAQNEMRIVTRLKDVAFRTETELGLLTTETVKCVCVDVELGV